MAAQDHQLFQHDRAGQDDVGAPPRNNHENHHDWV
jgi:hypothetical protein